MFTGPVTGKEFFDRRGLLASLRKNIHHAHHALIGPRGCGKSSILEQLATMERINEFVPVYINVAHIVPKTHRSMARVLGREALYAAAGEKGLLRSMPELIADRASRLADFVRDHLRVKIGEWVTLYFDPDSDLTDLMRETFNTIESCGTKLLIMLDEISSLVRLSGPQPKKEDMDFMEAMREYISKARSARYILSGSQLGIMRLIVTVKFGRHLTPVNVEGLEEDGADELIRAKMKRKIPSALVEEIKKRTQLWPLYLRAYCHAVNSFPGKPRHLEDVEDVAFRILHGHLSYLEGQLGEREIMILCTLDGGKVSEVASRLKTSYDSTLSIFRTLELKGFVKKVSPGTYGATDPVFLAWLRKEYGKIQE